MRNQGWFIALALVVGCDQLPTPNPLDPHANTPTAPPISSSANVDETASIQVFFSKVDADVESNKRNPENIANYCARVIGTARKTLDVCAFEIDNRTIVEAILTAHFNGVQVRVITETDYLKDLGPQAFQHAKIPVVSDNRSGLMHNKFLVIDGQAVWTGSFNLTENCANKNNNNGVYIRDAKVAANYQAWFNWFWETGRLQRSRSGGPTPFPDVQLADGTRVETRLTTFDHTTMDKTIAEVLDEASKSIKFLAFSFTNEGLARVMLRRADAGAKVMGVIESRGIDNSVYRQLSGHPNVAVYPDANPYNLHHKIIIVDEQVVIAGSYNFSKNASAANDENYVVISRNRAVAHAFVEEFNKVFTKASGRMAGRQEGNARR
jgi:phosphatidylserine/phosphatidylglycerophosphate/cardiolipin synthase-like enzyme